MDSPDTHALKIELWQPAPATFAQDLDALAHVLHACVHTGASVSFILPFTGQDALAYWRDQIAPAIEAGARRVFVARHDDRIVGTVQLITATPPNQPHRAEVAKLLIHPGFRRQGIARRLMLALEHCARELGRTLLTLDTRTGDLAEPLYLSLGYQLAGVIPRYARGPASPALESTTILYKELN